MTLAPVAAIQPAIGRDATPLIDGHQAVAKLWESSCRAQKIHRAARIWN